jgi:molybdopterin-containing oxidoreductase family iron-sulfur binding subunit
MSEQKKYYQHIQELKPGEFVKNRESAIEAKHRSDVISLLEEGASLHSSRRNFLKLAGFSTVLGTVLNSCEKPIHKAIPYLIKPEEITPGMSDFYASSFFDGEEFCSVLAKA